jgi:lipopolysaccharide transport system permease protein
VPAPQSSPTLRIRPRHGLAALNLLEVWAYRDVLWMLTLRDIKLRYRQTALGVVWVILQPLLAGLLFAVIFGRFAKLPSEGQPYLLFVFAGILGWNLFNGIIQREGNSVVAESKLITRCSCLAS